MNGIVHKSGVRVGKRIMKIFHESMLHNSFPKYDFSRINSRLDENVTSNESVQSSY